MRFLLVSILSLSAINAFAGKVTCETLLADVEESCERAMCEEVEAEGLECLKDGDFFEGLGVCVSEEFDAALQLHNKKNPSKKLACDDM